MRLGWLPLFVALVLVLILPWIFADLMRTALLKLQIAPEIATLIVAGILMGSLINIPVKRIEREELVPINPFALFGLGGLWSEVERARRDQSWPPLSCC